MQTDTLIPIEEVGKMLGGFSGKTIKRMCQCGELPPLIKIRRRSVLPASAVCAYIESIKEVNSKHKK